MQFYVMTTQIHILERFIGIYLDNFFAIKSRQRNMCEISFSNLSYFRLLFFIDNRKGISAFSKIRMIYHKLKNLSTPPEWMPQNIRTKKSLHYYAKSFLYWFISGSIAILGWDCHSKIGYSIGICYIMQVT